MKHMLTLDRIKIITKPQYIQTINEQSFSYLFNERSELLSSRYKTNDAAFSLPFNVGICINYMNNELMIEFSAKILGDDYYKLISIDTIHQCFENLNKLNIIRLDYKRAILDTRVVSCDITKDITFKLTNEVKKVLKLSVTNEKKWQAKIYPRNGIVFQKDVITNNAKERLSAYDKMDELNKHDNKPFIHSLNNKQELLNKFTDKTRFELNAKSINKIKRYLNIDSNTLLDVLHAQANPILTTFKKIIDADLYSNIEQTERTVSLLEFKNMKEVNNYLLIQACGEDIEKVREVVKNFYSEKSNMSKLMKSYKQVFAITQSNKHNMQTDRQIIQQIIRLLE